MAQGINWVDTAAVYGLGHSEQIVAAALRDIPEADRPYVFTKCGQVGDPNDRAMEPKHIMAPASVRREIEDSLRRLRVERIDLYQVHSRPQDGTLLEDYWGLMLELRDAMQSGLLTGKFTKERVAALPAGGWRGNNLNYTTKLAANLALADALGPIAERHDVSVASVAVAWTLAWPGVTGAIVGARGPSQVDGWLPAADLALTDADLDEIAEAINRTGAGDGQTRP